MESSKKQPYFLTHKSLDVFLEHSLLHTGQMEAHGENTSIQESPGSQASYQGTPS